MSSRSFSFRSGLCVVVLMLCQLSWLNLLVNSSAVPSAVPTAVPSVKPSKVPTMMPSAPPPTYIPTASAPSNGSTPLSGYFAYRIYNATSTTCQGTPSVQDRFTIDVCQPYFSYFLIYNAYFSTDSDFLCGVPYTDENCTTLNTGVATFCNHFPGEGVCGFCDPFQEYCVTTYVPALTDLPTLSPSAVVPITTVTSGIFSYELFNATQQNCDGTPTNGHNIVHLGVCMESSGFYFIYSGRFSSVSWDLCIGYYTDSNCSTVDTQLEGGCNYYPPNEECGICDEYGLFCRASYKAVTPTPTIAGSPSPGTIPTSGYLLLQSYNNSQTCKGVAVQFLTVPLGVCYRAATQPHHYCVSTAYFSVTQTYYYCTAYIDANCTTLDTQLQPVPINFPGEGVCGYCAEYGVYCEAAYMAIPSDDFLEEIDSAGSAIVTIIICVVVGGFVLLVLCGCCCFRRYSLRSAASPLAGQPKSTATVELGSSHA